jgi:putative chitinase
MAFINTLYNLWPSGDKVIPGLRDGIAKAAPIVFPKYGINSNLVIAHLMAQISHECGAGLDVVENLNYSAQRMTVVWPGRFPTINAAIPYAHNPRALGNKTYNGRMGNAPNSNDGYDFRGRGATQTTGRSGYMALQAFLAKHGLVLDLIKNPGLVNDPQYFLECGVADFVVCGCPPYAKLDNAVDVSALLNVGHIVPANRIVGFNERMAWLRRWKAADLTLS